MLPYIAILVGCLHKKQRALALEPPKPLAPGKFQTPSQTGLAFQEGWKSEQVANVEHQDALQITKSDGSLGPPFKKTNLLGTSSSNQGG